MMNETVRTIAQQIKARELSLAGFTLVCSEDSVTLHKGKKIMEIKYNSALDLYTVRQFKIKGLAQIVNEDTFEGIFNSDLKEMIQAFFRYEYLHINMVLIPVRG